MVMETRDDSLTKEKQGTPGGASPTSLPQVPRLIAALRACALVAPGLIPSFALTFLAGLIAGSVATGTLAARHVIAGGNCPPPRPVPAAVPECSPCPDCPTCPEAAPGGCSRHIPSASRASGIEVHSSLLGPALQLP